MSQSQKNTFYGGAAVLTISAMIIKVMGAIYRIPLGNIVSDEVMADYNSAYNIYSVLLTLSTAGLPVAVSKTISEATALNRRNQVNKIFQVAFSTFLALGVLSFVCMTVFAIPVSNVLLGNPKAVYCVLALSPSVLCVCLMSPIRGYFQGQMNMWPTGISQIIESFFKLVVGLILAFYFVRIAQKPDMGSVGAILGVSFGSVAALVYLAYVYLGTRRRAQGRLAQDTPDEGREIFLTLIKLAVPITIGSAATSLVSLLDGKLVMDLLQKLYINVDGMGAEAALDAARVQYGIYSKTWSLYNLPFSMMVPLTASIVPAVSNCLSKRDRQGARRISESAVRIGMIVSLPMCMGLVSLGEPIMALLFPGTDSTIAGPLLSILGVAAMFVSLQVLCNAILQANNMVNLPILVVVVGGIVKIIVNYMLVGNSAIRIYGAPVGTLCCFLVIAVVEMYIIRRAIPAAPHFGRAIAKPLAASAIMAVCAWAVYGLLSGPLKLSPRVAVLPAIAIAVLVYLALVLALHAISKEDLSLMPKGDKIAKLLRIS